MTGCQRHAQQEDAALPPATSDRLPYDRTISGPRRSRTASTAGPPAADTSTPGPSGVGAEPAWLDQLPDKLHGLQRPDGSQRGCERQANCYSGPIDDSASNPSPGGRGTGSAGFNFGCYDRYRSLLHIHITVHTHIQSGSPQSQAKIPYIYALCCQRRGRSHAPQVDQAEEALSGKRQSGKDGGRRPFLLVRQQFNNT